MALSHGGKWALSERVEKDSSKLIAQFEEGAPDKTRKLMREERLSY